MGHEESYDQERYREENISLKRTLRHSFVLSAALLLLLPAYSHAEDSPSPWGGTFSVGWSAVHGTPLGMPKMQLDFHVASGVGLFGYVNFMNSFGHFFGVGGGAQTLGDSLLNLRLGYGASSIASRDELISHWHCIYIEIPIRLFRRWWPGIAVTPGIGFIPDATHFNSMMFPLVGDHWTFLFSIEFLGSLASR